jgi:hypothetical protein
MTDRRPRWIKASRLGTSQMVLDRLRRIIKDPAMDSRQIEQALDRELLWRETPQGFAPWGNLSEALRYDSNIPLSLIRLQLLVMIQELEDTL